VPEETVGVRVGVGVWQLPAPIAGLKTHVWVGEQHWVPADPTLPQTCLPSGQTVDIAGSVPQHATQVPGSAPF